MARSGSYTCSG